MPPIVITQHIPPGFSAAFANRLNKLCALEVREAADGDILRRGLALLAPGDRHLLLRRTGSGYAVELERGPEVCYQRPSVDAMFHSVARAAGGRSIAVLLTGMGADGAKGMLALHSAGGATLAQDEASCVIYGMPREAVRLGAVDTIAPLADIPALLTRAVRPLRPSASASPVSSPATQEPEQQATRIARHRRTSHEANHSRRGRLTHHAQDHPLSPPPGRGPVRLRPRGRDGREALLLLRAHKVALILCDISMPGMSGIELLSRLRQEGLAVGVPILMVTAESGDAQLRQAILYGARGYIASPSPPPPPRQPPPPPRRIAPGEAGCPIFGSTGRQHG